MFNSMFSCILLYHFLADAGMGMGGNGNELSELYGNGNGFPNV